MNEQLANPYIVALIIAVPLFLAAASMAWVATRIGKLTDAINKLASDHVPVANNVVEIKEVTGRTGRGVDFLTGMAGARPND